MLTLQLSILFQRRLYFDQRFEEWQILEHNLDEMIATRDATTRPDTGGAASGRSDQIDANMVKSLQTLRTGEIEIVKEKLEEIDVAAKENGLVKLLPDLFGGMLQNLRAR